jgi:hypothetical protein
MISKNTQNRPAAVSERNKSKTLDLLIPKLIKTYSWL